MTVSPEAEPAVLVSVNFGRDDDNESLTELQLLAETAGVQVVQLFQCSRRRPDAAWFVGSGKAEEIATWISQQSAAPLVIFNHDLTPAQMKNLGDRLQTRVIDRTMLILDIFAQRARSHEGKVQVELAQLKYLSTRLTGRGIDMSQQTSAVGARGPGETQLERDRRKLGRRVTQLEKKLQGLQRQRTVMRRARTRRSVFSVALVGYTNAGKSTLFNRLTRSGSYVADQLFATLDTTTRRIHFPETGELVLSDTVGFIRHLPHSLVAAFRSTLEETVQADLLLHVVDVNHERRDEQIEAVNQVLAEIDAQHIPQLLVFNKIDLAGIAPDEQRDECDRIARVFLSARTGEGLDRLKQALQQAAKDRQKTDVN